MKYILFLLSLMLSNVVLTQPSGSSILMEKFVTQYNDSEYELIHSLFSDKLKESMTLVELQGLFQGLKAGIGKIVGYEYVATDSESFFHYKTTFEKSVLDVALSSENQNEISGFKVVPFDPADFDRNVINQLSDNSGLLSSQQLAILFELTKGFPNNTELAIGLIEKGQTKYYGLIIENDTVRTINNHKDVFEIGSISKVFTSTLMAQLVAEQQLKLDDKINVYFDFPFMDNIELSFLQLSNHSSGLSRLPSNLDLNKVDPDNPYKDYDKKNLDEYLKTELSLTDSLQGEYQYSNLGAGLLGYTLSRKMNTSYDQLLNNRIFDKYELNNTNSIRNEVTNRLVPGLNYKGEATANWDLSILAGAGGILSTIEDLTKFTLAHFDLQNKPLQATTASTLTVDDKLKIGLAWHLIKSESGRNWVWHNGGTGGYTSSLAMNKESKNAIIILSNVSALGPKMGFIDKLCFELLEILESK